MIPKRKETVQTLNAYLSENDADEVKQFTRLDMILFAEYHSEEMVKQIGELIKKDVREHITISGLRFEGVSWAEICRIIGKYGFKDEIPF